MMMRRGGIVLEEEMAYLYGYIHILKSLCENPSSEK